MPEEIVETARRCLDAFIGADYEAAAECFHEDAVWRNTAAFPGPRELVGPPAIVAFWRELFESFEGGESELERWSAGAEVIVLAVRTFGHGLASGAPVDVRYALTLTVRAGKVARVEVHGDYASAVRAAGLAE